jgi:hypothetical protein
MWVLDILVFYEVVAHVVVGLAVAVAVAVVGLVARQVLLFEEGDVFFFCFYRHGRWLVFLVWKEVWTFI